ncbi:MAG TPA: hypothetical protein VF235_00675 [Actinomycetota bacterium]
MRRLRALAVGLALLAGGAWPVAGAAAPACAAEGPHAGLVVDTGSRVLTLCVALDAGSVTGLHLIELAHDQHNLDYRLGLGGAAVCRLAGTGVNVDDCFADYPRYWGYWTSDGDGPWVWSSQGGLDVRVHDGDLQGWVWGEGDTGESHGAPPAFDIADVCVPAAPEPSEEPTPSQAPAPEPTEADPARSPEPVTTKVPTPTTSRTGTKTPDPSVSVTPSPSPSSSPEPTLVAAAVGPPDPEGGAPLGLLLGLGLVLVLAGAGFWRLRAGRPETAR